MRELRMWRRLRKCVAAFGILLLILLLAGVALGCPRYLRVAQSLSSLRGHLGRVEGMAREVGPSQLRGERLREMEAELAAARADLTALKDELAPVLNLAPRLGWLPYIGDDLVVMPRLVEIALGLTRGAELALKGLEPSAEALSVGRNPNLSELMRAISAGDAHFAQAEALLDWAAEEEAKLVLLPLLTPQARLLATLREYTELFRTTLKFLRAAPKLLGGSGPRRYLILAQNNYELRPTGGFISGVGYLELEDGEVRRLEFWDSYAVDDLSKPHPLPPAALRELMGAELWLLRDANWSPDFPRVAEVARDLFRLDKGEEVDGVIAVDLEALVLLLQATGPLAVPEFGETVSADDILQKAKSYWAPLPGKEQGGEWWVHRKDFMGEVLKAAIGRLTAGVGGLDLTALQEALGASLSSGHLLICLQEGELSQVLRERGWDGSLRRVERDYLLVVDSNVGFNKVDALVERSISYQIEIRSEDSVKAHLLLGYRNRSQKELKECVHQPRYHPTYRQMMEGCYWDYIRVYVPEGSRLLARDQPPGPDPEEAIEGKATFSGYIVIPPGGAEQVNFEYQLPGGVMAGLPRYQLTIQKQAGTPPVPVELSFKLPPGWRLAEIEAQAPLEEGPEGRWHFQLGQDQVIRVKFAQRQGLFPLQWALVGLGLAGITILVLGVMVRRWGKR